MELLSRRASSFLGSRPSSASPLSPKPSTSSLKPPKPKKTLSSSDIPSPTTGQFPPIVRRRTTPPPDPTPTTTAGLEGLLNFHLAQIDTLRARKQWLHEQRERDWIILARLQREPGRAREAKYMEDRVEALSECRQSCKQNMWWHQDESERLAALVKRTVGKARAVKEMAERAERDQAAELEGESLGKVDKGKGKEKAVELEGDGAFDDGKGKENEGVWSPDDPSESSAASALAPKPSVDLKRIRQNPELYSQNCVDRNYQSQKFAPFRIQDAFLEWQKSQADARSLRETNNVLKKRLTALAESKETAADEERGQVLREAQQLKEKLSDVGAKEHQLQTEMHDLAYRLPNLTSRETPIGSEPRLVHYINQHPDQSGRSRRVRRSHVEIGEELQLLDWTAARTSSGTGWYFLANEAALMEQALVQYALSVAMKRGWKIVSPPSMVYSHIVSACGFLPRDQNGEQQIYTVTQPAKDQSKPEHSLTGTAEIPLAAMKADATLNESQLPLKVIGTSRCYRAEAGARGAQSKGLYRVHEFTKVEMFAWTARDPETQDDTPPAFSPSETLLKEMVDIQTEILQSLNLHCRILEMPSHDLGGSASRKQDIEAFFPSRRDTDDGWGEVTSASICTDYQTRRLATRLQGEKRAGTKSWPYTVNGTAMAAPRVLAAILENCWDDERGIVRIPQVLRPWMGGLEVISRK